MNHTANDFAVPSPYDRGYEHMRRAAKLALDGHYVSAVEAYKASISAFEESTMANAGQRIAFAESEIARLEGLLQGGAR